jgi:DNA-binding transcriptional LysR family regulator
MTLTDAGQRMLEYARRILDEVERARSDIQPTEGPVQGVVNVGLLASTSSLLATRLTAAVARDYPGIRLRLSIGYAGHLLKWLEAGDIDLALTYADREAGAIQTQALLSEALWAVAPASAGLRQAKPVALARVAREPFVMPAAPQGLRSLIEQGAAAQGLDLRISVETNELSVQKALVMEGWGWTILPAVGVSAEVQRGELSAAPLSKPSLQRRITLAIPTNRPSAAAVRCVTASVTACVKDAVDSGRWTTASWLAA